MVPLPADVTDAQMVEAAFAQFIASTGRLDVLFNNAGMFTPAGPIDQISLADWQNSVDVNLTGMFLCARAVLSMATQPPEANVLNMTLMANKMPFVGRG